MKNLFTIIMLFAATLVMAQGTVTGVVLDGSSNESLIGASVVLKGTTIGTVTDFDGSFSLNVENGTQDIVISYVGYETMVKTVTIDNNTQDLGTILLGADGLVLSDIEVVASFAVERKTPVAFAKMDKKEIEKVLGSRDIPLMMNLTPSVYATEQGGGSGDSRINVRGFNQRNVAIMINGVPVNDMENGWVYWSNWDGISDATESVQLQRGLSSVNLATPSIGGTMNIVSSAADKKAGGYVKAEIGTGGFLKTTVSGNTGLINNKFAVSMSGVRKVGKGIVDKTWTDAWAYYLGASYLINDAHKLELFAMGAPQRHGQSLYKQNIAAYGHEFAKTIDGYDTNAFDKFPEANSKTSNQPEESRLYNQNWNTVSSSYKGQQAVGDRTFDRHDENYINERENFYHKPLVNLNWYADWSDKVSQYTTVYWSGGNGGGSGTMGSMKWNYNEGIDSPSRIVMWDATIAANKENGAGGSKGILRNSRNNQTTIGAISKFKITWNKNFKSTVGIDWRTATIEHYREVRDLLGGDFYMDDSDAFNSNKQAKLGDRVGYNFTNNVDWIGGFAQSEYSAGPFSAFGMVGYSQIKYDYTNHFKKANNSDKEFYVGTEWIAGIQVKGGANYRVTDNVNVFTNLGYVSKVPIFDAVIHDQSGALAQDPKNEKFYAGELGVNYFSSDDNFVAKLSGYYTQWNDRTKSISVYDSLLNEDGLVFITGMNQLHTGIELDLKYKPHTMVELGVTTSLANWKSTNDVKGTYDPDGSGSLQPINQEYFVKDLRVGDAPQSQFVTSVRFMPVDGLNISAIYSYYANFYADWDPFSRTTKEEEGGARVQSWKLPNYALLNFHASYDLPLEGKIGVSFFGHIFNALNTLYISDAVDNSKYNGYKITDANDNKVFANPHGADAAEIFLGSPVKFNVGAKVTF